VRRYRLSPGQHKRKLPSHIWLGAQKLTGNSYSNDELADLAAVRCYPSLAPSCRASLGWEVQYSRIRPKVLLQSIRSSISDHLGQTNHFLPVTYSVLSSISKPQHLHSSYRTCFNARRNFTVHYTVSAPNALLHNTSPMGNVVVW